MKVCNPTGVVALGAIRRVTSRVRCTPLVAVAAMLGTGGAAIGGGTELKLAFPPGIVCLAPGDVFRVQVRMLDVPMAMPAAGFQAFVGYDPAKATFLSGGYTSIPFGLPVIPVTHVVGEVDLAAGINLAFAQPPSSADAMLAELFFVSIDGDPDDVVWFRSTVPETTLTDLGGTAIEPLDLVDLFGFSGNIPGDLNGDGVVDGIDLGILLANWGPCVPPNVECLGDLNCDKQVDAADLGILLANWSVF